MNATGIEWCDRTWNVITGCRHGCPYCYARSFAETRLRGRHGYDAARPFDPAFHANRLQEPLREQTPRLIFPSSMGDAFGDWVPREWIADVIGVCVRATWHRFIWLTKNPQRYLEFDWPANCWLGTSITGAMGEAERRRTVAMAWVAEVECPTVLSLEPFTRQTVAPPLGWSGMRWLIVGAQTKPLVLPSPDALVMAVADARDAGAAVFVKDSLADLWAEVAPGEPLPREWPDALRVGRGKSAKRA